MKKALAALLAAFSMILAVPQHASATPDWHHFRAAWLTHRGITLNFPLRHDPSLSLREWRHFSRQTLHRAYGRWQYKLAHPPIVVSSKPTQPVEPSHQGGPPPSGGIRGLVCSYSWSCAIATCVISHESNWNPHAYNPSGAAGYLQLMPIWYNGHWHFDPFNGALNIYYGHKLYEMYGWSPWHGDPCV